MLPKINRRNFFKAAATGGAVTAITACAEDPVEKLVPYLVPPDNYIRGVANYFSTTCNQCASQCGMVVKTREGRAIHVEGNPDHPGSQGFICSQGSSSLQETYSPARIKAPSYQGSYVTWNDAKKTFGELIAGNRGKVLYICNGFKGAYQKLIDQLLSEVNGSKLNFNLNPLQDIIEANQLLFGRKEIPQLLPEKADVLLSFGADFIESWGSVGEFTKSFTKARAYKNGKKSKFHHFGPHLSLTAFNADQWHPVETGFEHWIVLALIQELLPSARLTSAETEALRDYLPQISKSQVTELTGVDYEKIRKIAKDFGTSGKGLAIAGGCEVQSKANKDLQIAVQILNYIGGAINRTVVFGADYQIAGDSYAKVKDELEKLKSDQYNVVIIDSVNILHSLPESEGLSIALKNKKVVVLSTTETETSRAADLTLPIHSGIESWGSSAPREGIHAISQPAMVRVPGFDSLDKGDLILDVAKLINSENLNFAPKKFMDYVKREFKNVQSYHNQIGPFEIFWKKSLQKGGFFHEFTPQRASLLTEKIQGKKIHNETSKKEGLRLVVFNSNLHNIDGLSSDRTWLLEIPHPITQVVWDTWAEIHHDTAKELGIRHGDEVEVSSGSASFKLSAYVYHGVAKNTVAIPGGMGRSVLFPNYSQRRNWILPFTTDKPKELKTFQVGVNAVDLIENPSEGTNFPFADQSVSVKPTGKKGSAVSMDGMWRDDIEVLNSERPSGYGDRGQKGRNLFQSVSLEKAKERDFEPEGIHHLRKRNYTVQDTVSNTSFYKSMKDVVKDKYLGTKPNDDPSYHEDYRFEMSIDLDRCTGCSACVIACFSENNVPVVGKERQRLGRHMSWIRIERYFDQEKDGTIRNNIGPSMCQQCSNAGCEPVCPVYATYHNPDGLNAQVYNRCVGTRYCSNNCIYKQRKFNWRTYEFPYPLNLQLNPSVTVRSKGVMEKCTFCVQRIEEGKIKAKGEGRMLRGEEIQTACQKSCPTDAIQFGNALDPKSRVARLKEQERKYHQLEELNFQPAVTYRHKVYHNEA